MKKRLVSALLSILLLFAALPMGTLASGHNYGSIPIYIGYADVDYMAEEILKEIPTQGKNARDQIQAVYDWIIRHCSRYDWDGTYYFDQDKVLSEARPWSSGIQQKLESGDIALRPEYEEQSFYDPASGMMLLSYDSNRYIANFAAEMMYRRTGNCAHYSALLALLLGHLGFDCRLIPGEFINGNGSTAEHKWNYVLVDGKYYWLDVRMDHASSSGSKLSHKYFMVADTGEWAKRHSWDHDYSDWLAANASALAEEYARYSVTLSGEPWSRCSNWARDYMKAAYDQKLIPDRLLGADLTKSITRAEFASVALALYKNLKGRDAPAYNGPSPFTDTDDSDVLRAYGLGIVNGSGDVYLPNDPLSREQACTMLGRVCELVKTGSVGDGSGFDQGGIQSFADDGAISGYARNYLYYLAGQGIIDGVGDGKFSPRTNMERQAALKVASETAKKARP